MPNLRLSDQEAADIAAHIMQEYRSDHVLADHQFASLDLKDVASKGYNIIKTYGCYGCHFIKGFEDMNKVAVPLNDFGNKIVQQLYWGTVSGRYDDSCPRTFRFHWVAAREIGWRAS